MIRYKFYLLLFVLGLLIISSCGQNKTKKEMKWLTTNTKYEGFPLFLRFPDYENVWSYKGKFSNLLCITHKLEKVNDNGLPEPEYNLTLSNFDGDMVELFDRNSQGIIILVETFGGERNYWYYVSSMFDYKINVDNIKRKYPSNKIEINFRPDLDWGFLNNYPIKLYNKK
jgi:hypothetical protein